MSIVSTRVTTLHYFFKALYIKRKRSGVFGSDGERKKTICPFNGKIRLPANEHNVYQKRPQCNMMQDKTLVNVVI